jgi:hypothetical protein
VGENPSPFWENGRELKFFDKVENHEMVAIDSSLWAIALAQIVARSSSTGGLSILPKIQAGIFIILAKREYFPISINRFCCGDAILHLNHQK